MVGCFFGDGGCHEIPSRCKDGWIFWRGLRGAIAGCHSGRVVVNDMLYMVKRWKTFNRIDVNIHTECTKQW